MIRRETDAALMNEIANDPEVRGLMFLGMVYPQYDLDFDHVFDDAKTIVLSDGAGFASIFKWTSPGTYECHIMAKTASRGAEMMRHMRVMLDFMKEQGARVVWGQPSVHNRGALCFIRRMGLKSVGKGSDPILGDVEYFVTENL